MKEDMNDLVHRINRRVAAAYPPPSLLKSNYVSMELHFPDDAPNFPDRIIYRLPVDDNVIISLHDMLGHELLRLLDAFRTAGAHVITLDRGAMPAGKYLLRLKTPNDACFRVLSFT